MAPLMANASLTLTYPINAADFDPEDDAFLVVGGGGGEGRSGVKNKITLINTSKRQEISELVDIELSGSEDSVTSLSVACADDISATIFAGINSSIKDQEQGKNEHLRSFKLRYPSRKKPHESNNEEKVKDFREQTTEVEALSKSGLFTSSIGKKQETYQRILRLSQRESTTGRQIGAVATGLAPAGEIVIFDASNNKPANGDIRHRIRLGAGQEAGDVDIIEYNDNQYLVAYCTDYEVFICVVPFDMAATTRTPYIVHASPHPDIFTHSAKRPVFRALRFLTPQLLLLVRNKSNRSGADLLLLDVPTTPIQGTIVLRKTLHKNIKSVSCVAKATMPGPTPTHKIQHAIAVAGQDISLTILTLDHDPRSKNQSLSFRTHSILRNVHPMQMTALAFSRFKQPRDPSKALPQYLKLASTSMCSTIKVHTFPLIPFPAYSKKQPSRYTLQSPATRNEQAQMGLSIIVAVVMVALGAFFLQIFTEIRGATPEYLGAKSWFSKSTYDKPTLPYMLTDQPRIIDFPRSGNDQSDTPNTHEGLQEAVSDPLEQREILPLSDIFARRRIINADDPDAVPLFSGIENWAVIVRDDEQGLSTEMHHDEEILSKEGKKWEDLDSGEQMAWKKRLVDARIWAVEEGEAILKGIFFGAVVEGLRR